MSKEKLTIEHLAPFLPYSLKMTGENGEKYNVAWMSTKNIAVINTQGFGELEKHKWSYASGRLRPILRPLSDLQNPEWLKQLLQEDIDNIIDTYRIDGHLDVIEYYLVNRLLKNHFDVFGLIEKGLAVQI